MRVGKLIKKFNRANEKNIHVKRTIVDNRLEGQPLSAVPGTKYKCGPKNKQAFRFFRDQFEGEIQSAIDWVYKIGGSMELSYGNASIEIKTYEDNGKLYEKFELQA